MSFQEMIPNTLEANVNVSSATRTTSVQFFDNLLHVRLGQVHAQTLQDLAQFTDVDAVVVVLVERAKEFAYFWRTRKKMQESEKQHTRCALVLIF